MTSSPKRSFEARLNSGPPVFLDGATGTELERRGFSLASPDWSAAAIRRAPELLAEIHRDYAAAGAELITVNTFRTHPRNLKGTAWNGLAEKLTREAVQIARSAVPEHCYIAGSLAPLEDCYSPELTPPWPELVREHETMVESLVAAGVDVVLIETQITMRESLAAARCCRTAGVPFCVSFTLDRAGHLLSGDSLVETVNRVLPYDPLAILVNCIPADEVMPAMLQIQAAGGTRPQTGGFALGAYANTGRLSSAGTWESTECENPAVYAGYAQQWKEFGFRLIGGCCGTTPEHISLAASML